jgi:putative membrane protein
MRRASGVTVKLERVTLAAADATRRTRLANERTFLAWWRTGLGAYGLALAAGRVLPEVVGGQTWPYVLLGAAFALLGVLVTGFGWWRYASLERRLSGGEEASTPGWVIAVLGLAGVMSGLGIAALVVAS